MSKKGSFYRKYLFARKTKNKGKKLIIHMHSSQFLDFYENSGSSIRRRINKLFQIADRVIVLTEYWKKEFEQLCDKNKLCILGNGVDIPAFQRTNYEDNNILFLGKVCEQKGINELLQAMGSVGKRIPDSMLYISGNGNVDEYQKMSEKIGVNSHVEFTGWIEGKKKMELLKKCSLFVLPSYSEGLPVSLIEAMSYGCACVATNVGGAGDNK